MSWQVLYLSGRGKLRSLRYRMTRALSGGRSALPVVVVTGFPHTWGGGWKGGVTNVCRCAGSRQGGGSTTTSFRLG